MVFHDYKCKGVGKLQPDSVAHCASTDGVWGLLCVNVDTNVCTRVCMYMCVWWRAAVLLPQLTKQPSFRLKVNVKSYSNWICTRNSTQPTLTPPSTVSVYIPVKMVRARGKTISNEPPIPTPRLALSYSSLRKEDPPLRCASSW